MSTRLILLASVLVATPIAAEDTPHQIPKGQTITARCVGVHDGDTITLLVETGAAKQQVKIRLDAIDAPEIGQPFGDRAKHTLSDLVFGKDCRIESMGQDKYARTIGRISVEGRDVNLAMLDAGMAWHFTKYDQRPELAKRETLARENRVGLWADLAAIPPWHWRKMPKAERDGVRQSSSTELLK